MRKIEKGNPKFARSLEQKLIDGNRLPLIEYAKKCKHKINKKISKYGLFQTANDVYIYILAHIENKFITKIKLKIYSKDFKEYEIDDMIDEHIIDTLWDDCQNSSLFDDASELYGLLYLLTGNCHIDWDVEI